jgi:hypothetical protein
MTRRDDLVRLLAAYDKFMVGDKMTDAEMEAFRAVATASSFAGAAYDDAAPYSHAAHVLARSFLIALIDPNDPQLDYLRAEPGAGAVARDASARLSALIAQEDAAQDRGAEE